MFPLLSLSATAGYSHTLLYSVLRCIVLVEVVQNAWSFSIFVEPPPRKSDLGLSRGGQSPNPSKHTHPWGSSEHMDEHRLKDIFLDVVSSTEGPPTDPYRFDDGIVAPLAEGASSEEGVSSALGVEGDDDNGRAEDTDEHPELRP